MKSNYFFSKKISIYSLFGLMALLTASCSSYQSTSYYDSDGVYGGNEKGNSTSQTEPTMRKDYFSAYKTDDTQLFTDVENYNTTYENTPSAVVVQENGNYGGWGDSTEGVTVNVYGGGWPYYGWNNYWYGSYWGWNSWGPGWGIGWGWGGYPYYGWGGYGWGWNNGYYRNGWYNGHYHNNSYPYNGGRRNYHYNDGSGRGRSYSSGRPNANGRSYSTGRSYTTGTRNNSYTTGGTRNYTPRATNANTRSDATAPRQNNNNTYSAPRSSAPTRSYTPSSSGGSRSSGYGGGGGNYGGGGGSRGGGGGGRR